MSVVRHFVGTAPFLSFIIENLWPCAAVGTFAQLRAKVYIYSGFRVQTLAINNHTFDPGQLPLPNTSSSTYWPIGRYRRSKRMRNQ